MANRLSLARRSPARRDPDRLPLHDRATLRPHGRPRRALCHRRQGSGRSKCVWHEAGSLQVLLHPDEGHRACGHRRETGPRTAQAATGCDRCRCALHCAEGRLLRVRHHARRSRHRPAVDRRYVSAFVPKSSGEHFNPHITTGVGPRAYLDQMLAEPFEPFMFSPAGTAVYQLGQFGTAAKKLKEWDLKR